MAEVPEAVAPTSPPRRRRKVLLSVLVLGLAAAAATVATYASFTATATVDQGSVSSATISLSVPAAGASNRLTLGAAAIVPGDTMQRAVDLTNPGTDDLSGLSLTAAAATSSLLDTDTTNGLQLTIDRCSQAWTESGSSPAFTYTCGGTTSSVLATRPVIGTGLSLANVTATTAGNTDHLRVTLTFPATAGNSLQTQTSAISYTFTGAQRAATAR